jgi:hypothetical protein
MYDQRVSAVLRGPAICLLLISTLSLQSCKPKFPADPGLLTDNLGTGVKLGISEQAARDVAARGAAGLTLWVLTPDELNERDPYNERPQGTDLALYSPELKAGGAHSAGPAVYELRCYLAPPPGGAVRLLGKPAAQLTSQIIIDSLGQPADKTEGNDGRTYLTYYFLGNRGRGGVRLVTSHETDGHCFAVLLSTVGLPK